MERIGIYGGTFNPVHIMHLIVAEQFVSQANLDLCYFVPAFISPFKANETEILADANFRISMINLAIENNDNFRLCTYETEREGISYSYDTLQYLKGLHPEAEFHILIGSDQAADFKKWNKWQNLLDESIINIVKRPSGKANNLDKLPEELEFNNKARILDSPVSDLSSTYIRGLVKARASIKYLVPNKVEKYIAENKLYR